ncbi:MAG: hypothetical protein J6B31_08760 [Bacteroidaceae bacterium]|nr:hypothetical protein [Bacteroidaceae bacterium]
MNKLIFFFCFNFIYLNLYAQQYICDKLKEDIEAWNACTNKNNTTKWAIAILEQGAFKQNADGSFEYVYILSANDSVNIKTLRDISFNFIALNFNTDNALRADMETNSPDDGLIFQGKLVGLGDYSGFATYNKINGNVYFDIRFKPNRVRFSVKIQDYQVIKYFDGALVENYSALVKDCFPINEESNHKKSFAMAFINANSKCLNYANAYLEYINKNVKASRAADIEDW